MSKSIDSERAVIGCMLLDPTVIPSVYLLLWGEDFVDATCRTLFQTILGLVKAGEVVDMVTVSTRLRELKKLDEVGGPEYLAELQNSVPLASHALNYAKKVKCHSFLRKLSVAGENVKKVAETSEKDIPETMKDVRKCFQDVVEIVQLMQEKPKEDTSDPIDRPNTGLTWGTSDLDSRITPIERHHFIVLAAETKSGKTAFLFDVAIKNAINKKVLYITLEMSGSQIISRIARNYSGITKDQWRNRKSIPEPQYNAYKIKMEEINQIKGLTACGLGDTSLVNIFKTIKKENADLTVVDNFGLIEKDDKMDQTSHESKLSAEFARFCHTNNIPVILVHHFKKGDESKSQKPRGLNAIRGSSKITHDADTVILCHRTTAKNNDLTKEQSSQFTVVEAADRDFGVGGVKTLYFWKGSFFDKYPGAEPGFK